MARLLAGEFGQGAWALLPALAILALPLLGAGMKASMMASLAAAALAAGATILSMAGSPVGGFGFTFYLWLIPLWHLAGSLFGRADIFARAKTFLKKVLANLGALPYSNFSR